jgi:hypothetical protein
MKDSLTQEQREYLEHCINGDWDCDNDGRVHLSGHFFAGGSNNQFAFEKKGYRGIRFGIVLGNFNASNIGLESLEGSPYEVKGNFNVSHNRLSSTKFSPKRIGGAYNISHNKIFDLTDYPIVNQGTIHHGNTLSISDMNMIIMLMKSKQIDFGLALSLAFENLTAYGQELLKPFLDKNHEKYKKLNDIGVI